MSKYQIETRAGEVFGVFEGETPEQAFAAMVSEFRLDGEDSDGNSTAGTAADWIIVEVA